MKKISYNCLSIICVLLVFMSCDDDTKNNNNIGLKLTDLDEVTFPIDEDTNPNVNLKLNVINAKPYLSFFNSNSYSIYIYNYAEKRIVKKIPLEKEGPNGINSGGLLVPQFFVHTLDSIFIAGRTDHYIIDDKGKVLSRGRLKNNDKTIINSGDRTISFDAATYYKSKKLYTGITSYAFSKKAPYLQAVLPFPFDSITKTYLKEDVLVDNYEELVLHKKELLNQGMLVVMGLNYQRHNESLYVTTPVSDTVYIFKNQNLVDKIYTGCDAIKMPENKVYFDQFNRKTYETALEYPFYKDLLLDIDSDRNYIYRIVSKGEVIDKTTNEGNSISKGIELAVTDINTKITTYIELPKDDINVYGGFVINNEIHLKLRNQDQENEIAYKVFKVE